MRSQLTNYDPDKDKASSGPKIAQDLVATYCMAAYSIRAWFNYDPTGESQREKPEDLSIMEQAFGGREIRLSIPERQIRLTRSSE
jgi:hypothetical protein